MLKKIVVLGHSGYVGNRLMGILVQQFPDQDVVGISSQNIDLLDERDVVQLKEHFCMDTAVVMCSGVKSNFGDTLENCGKNIRMAENVCRILKEQPVKRFIFFSSIAVYGVFKHDTAITEKTPVEIDTHYGLSKFCSEKLLDMTFNNLPGSSLVLLRTPTIYGPHERIRTSTPSGFLTTYLNGEEVTLWGDGSERREFVFIEDIVKIVGALIANDFSGIINTSSGEGNTYKDALDIIGDLLGRELIVHSRERTMSKVSKVYDIGLFRGIFPDFPFTSLKEGLRAIKEAEKEEQYG
jgi:UDP-glucose 4-epimerase